ncbi:MAG: sensor histidine kinase [Lachnospiraceae bacterium]|nr:sensor histidine kinase [Lachnospiraceae bacterium]
MKQKRRSLIHWFGTLRLSHKMMMAVGLLFFCSNLAVLFLISHVATAVLKQKACDQLQGQLSVTLSVMDSSFSDITDLMVQLALASDLADYVDRGAEYESNHLKVVNGANESMRVLLRANNMIDYVALIRLDDPELLYQGEPQIQDKTNPEYNIRNIFLENYQGAEQLRNSSIQYNVQKEHYRLPELNLFYPVCRRYASLGEDPVALLVVGVNTEKMLRYVAAEDENLHIRFLTADGVVLVSEEPEQIGIREEQFAQYQGRRGQFAQNDGLVVYQYSKDGLWAADGQISQKILFADIRRISWLLSLVILFATFLSIAVSAVCCGRFYAPMQEIIRRMQQVSEGKLDQKMGLYEEKDFRQLSRGFNHMTESIQNLIAEVHEQEQEMTEIRLNALQSQIKPHFLYNTLECIHWQALLEGNVEVSRIVMALSKYYRLCLSKGQDLVPLSQELEHTDSYVTIQNMRFDNIVQMEIRIDDGLLDRMLPKITLQPLVENAIYHGIKTEEDRKGHILITGQKVGEEVLLTVEDDGVGMTEEEIDRLNQTIDVLINDGSYGVKNVHQRLAIRYGKEYGLYYRKNPHGGITVEIRLPGTDGEREPGGGEETFVQYIDRG